MITQIQEDKEKRIERKVCIFDDQIKEDRNECHEVDHASRHTGLIFYSVFAYYLLDGGVSPVDKKFGEGILFRFSVLRVYKPCSVYIQRST